MALPLASQVQVANEKPSGQPGEHESGREQLPIPGALGGRGVTGRGAARHGGEVDTAGHSF